MIQRCSRPYGVGRKGCMHFCIRRRRGASGGACDPTLRVAEGGDAEADHNPVGEGRPRRTNGGPDKARPVGLFLTLLETAVLLLAAVFLATGCGFGGGGNLTLGYLSWDENVANSYLIKVLLEDELGYENVELKLANDVGPAYKDLIAGETDAFLDAWMPNHEQFVERGKGKIEVSKEPWYVDSTRYGIAVPAYMKGVRSISDPENAMGSVDAPQTLHSVAREGFAKDEPAAYALINAMRLDEDQVGSLELAINKAEDPEAGVRRWLEEKEERGVVRPWVEAAKNAEEE